MRARESSLAGLLALTLFVAAFPPSNAAAAGPADLSVELAQHNTGARDLKLAIVNRGQGPAPATSLQVETLAPGSDTGSGTATIKVPKLDSGSDHRFLADYRLGQSCAPGVRVRARVDFAGDPTPANNTLLFYPCQPDLRISYQGQASDQAVQFRVDNLGGETAPARNVHFDSLTTPPSNSVDVPIGALKPGQSTTVTYALKAPCPGLQVKGEVLLAEDGAASNTPIALFPCAPDLQFSFLRYVDANRDLALEITNAGGVASPPITARVGKIAPPTAVGDARDFAVPALKTGQTFTLTYAIGTGLCPGGLQVRASAPLDVDANPVDNVLTQTVCDKNGIVAPGLSLGRRLTKIDFTKDTQAVLSAPGPTTNVGDLVHPESAPGVHVVDLAPSASQVRTVDTNYTPNFSLGCLLPYPEEHDAGLIVGWLQAPVPGDCRRTDVAQTAVRFDLSRVDQVPVKQITGATLTFDEQEALWTDSDGNERSVPGCVAVLGLASCDWVAGEPADGLLPNATIADFRPWPSDRQDFNGHQFDVTGWVQTMFLPNPPGVFGAPGPDLRTPRRYGFVLRGAIEDLHADDFSSCMSVVSNVQLHITYSVPPHG